MNSKQMILKQIITICMVIFVFSEAQDYWTILQYFDCLEHESTDCGWALGLSRNSASDLLNQFLGW